MSVLFFTFYDAVLFHCSPSPIPPSSLSSPRVLFTVSVTFTARYIIDHSGHLSSLQGSFANPQPCPFPSLSDIVQDLIPFSSPSSSSTHTTLISNPSVPPLPSTLTNTNTPSHLPSPHHVDQDQLSSPSQPLFLPKIDDAPAHNNNTCQPAGEKHNRAPFQPPSSSSFLCSSVGVSRPSPAGISTPPVKRKCFS